MNLVNVTKAAAVVVLLVWGTTANPGTSPDAKVRLSTTASGQEVPGQTPAALAPRANSVRTVDFHLRTGELIYGKVLTEDKNKITIERLDESKIVVNTYGRREIDPRTLDIKTVPEYRYYLDLADYFAGRTWDFRDDPDDFIQAIRCCEKAKSALGTTAAGQDSERIEQINERIKKLEADRQVWEIQVKSRAELKKLKFEAEAVNKLKELEEPRSTPAANRSPKAWSDLIRPSPISRKTTENSKAACTEYSSS